MNENIVVTGAEELSRLGNRLEALGRSGLRDELYNAIDAATEPMKREARLSAATSLPRRGGLAKRVASSTIATVRNLSGPTVGVRVIAVGTPNRSDIAGMDRGRVRHPVFGNRKVWVTQAVRPGWFSRPADRRADAARRELVRAIDDIARRL